MFFLYSSSLCISRLLPPLFFFFFYFAVLFLHSFMFQFLSLSNFEFWEHVLSSDIRSRVPFSTFTHTPLLVLSFAFAFICHLSALNRWPSSSVHFDSYLPFVFTVQILILNFRGIPSLHIYIPIPIGLQCDYEGGVILSMSIPASKQASIWGKRHRLIGLFLPLLFFLLFAFDLLMSVMFDSVLVDGWMDNTDCVQLSSSY